MRTQFIWEEGVTDDLSFRDAVKKIHQTDVDEPELPGYHSFDYVLNHAPTTPTATLLCTLVLTPEENEFLPCRVTLEVTHKYIFENYHHAEKLSLLAMPDGPAIDECKDCFCENGSDSVQACKDRMLEFASRHLPRNIKE